MNGNIVHCPYETRGFLTVETREGGVTRSVLANLDGTPVRDSGVKYASDDPAHVEVFLDTISGSHVVRVTHSQSIAIRKEGEKVYQGVGGVSGWFIEAPDFTIAGRHGEKFKPGARQKVEATVYGGPDPNKMMAASTEASNGEHANLAPLVTRTTRKKAKRK